jgi:hypothetical protein
MINYGQRKEQLHALAGTLPERERRLLTAPWDTLTEEEQTEALRLANLLGRVMGRREAAGQLRRAGRRR